MTAAQKIISGPDIPRIEVVHEDDRRTVREVNLRLPDGTMRHITHLAIKGSGVLGNHYHNDGPEHFAVINGNPLVVTAPHSNPTRLELRRFPDGGYVTMAPGEAHAFYFDQPGDLISTMDGVFNPDDMHPQKLEIPAPRPSFNH